MNLKRIRSKMALFEAVNCCKKQMIQKVITSLSDGGESNIFLSKDLNYVFHGTKFVAEYNGKPFLDAAWPKEQSHCFFFTNQRFLLFAAFLSCILSIVAGTFRQFCEKIAPDENLPSKFRLVFQIFHFHTWSGSKFLLSYRRDLDEDPEIRGV